MLLICNHDHLSLVSDYHYYCGVEIEEGRSVVNM